MTTATIQSSVVNLGKHVANADKRAIGFAPWARHSNFTDVSSVGTSIKDAIEASPLNFTVRTEPVFLADGRAVDSKAIIRNDNDKIICHAAGPDWTPVQNQHKFDWFNKYVEDKTSTLIHAGYLGDGEKVCLIARLNQNDKTEIAKDDEVAKYLLLTDSFIPGFKLKVMLLIARLRCMNGMIGFQEHVNAGISHRLNIQSNMDGLHNDVALWQLGFDQNVEQAKFLASKPVKNNTVLVEYFTELMDFKEKANKKTAVVQLPTRSKNTLDKLVGLFEDKVYNGSERSWWNAYNSITAWQNHFAGRTTDSALDSLWFGANARKGHQAMKLAIDYASAV